MIFFNSFKGDILFKYTFFNIKIHCVSKKLTFKNEIDYLKKKVKIFYSY